MDEFEDDMWQMFQNAATYNEPGSEIYEDAKVLEVINRSLVPLSMIF